MSGKQTGKQGVRKAQNAPKTLGAKRGPIHMEGAKRTTNKRIRNAYAVPHGANSLSIPKGARFVGFGDYTETKGRALYDKKKAKKKGGKKPKSNSWWDMASDIGEKVAPLLGKFAMGALSGFGDYEISSNSVSAAATGGKIGGEIPLMENSKCANIMHHREYVGPVMGSTSEFKIQKILPINPGMSEPFPWVAPIAACYTRYRLRGAVVCYEPLASDYTTAGSLGFIALASQYNPLDANFTSKREMLNHEYSCEAKPSKSLVHPIECAPSQLTIDEYYLRDGPIPANADIRFYDLCSVTIATGGNPVNTQVGDLWITYEVEFYQPKINPAPRAAEMGDWYGIKSTTAYSIDHPLAGIIEANTDPLVGRLITTLSTTGAANTDSISIAGSVVGDCYQFTYVSSGGDASSITAAAPLFSGWNTSHSEVALTLGQTSSSAGVTSTFMSSVIMRILLPAGLVKCNMASYVVPNNGSPTRTLYITKVPTIPRPALTPFIPDDSDSSEDSEDEEHEREMEMLLNAYLYMRKMKYIEKDVTFPAFLASKGPRIRVNSELDTASTD